jgi:hypothetical protein
LFLLGRTGCLLVFLDENVIIPMDVKALMRTTDLTESLAALDAQFSVWEKPGEKK